MTLEARVRLGPDINHQGLANIIGPGRTRRGEKRTPSDHRTMSAALSLVGAAHPPASIEAWRLEGAGLDEAAVVALVS